MIQEGRDRWMVFSIRRTDKRWSLRNDETNKRYYIKVDSYDIGSLQHFLKNIEAKSPIIPKTVGEPDYVKMAHDLSNGKVSQIYIKSGKFDEVKNTWSLTESRGFLDYLRERQENDEKDELYKKWKKLINMSGTEIDQFLDSEEGKEAGLSRKEASAEGISSGRDSGRAIIRMLDLPKDKWSDNDWKWAKKQVSFISRMKAVDGPLRKDGKRTRKTTSLMIWGHNPEKG